MATAAGSGGVAAPSAAGTGAPPAGAPAAAPTDDARVPPEVASSWKQWPLPGKDYNNSRYSTDTRIGTANVKSLEEAWRFDLGGIALAYGVISTVPLIVENTVYFSDTSNAVRAIDLKNGQLKWATPAVDFNPGPNGVAVGWGKVFAIGGSDSVIAYDAKTGNQLWAKRVVDTPTDGIDIQPTVFDDMVLVSTVPISGRGIYTGGDRGILKALDQKTGDERWHFDTIESKGDVWGNSMVNSGGGSWYPPSFDLTTGRVFWAVANPAPFTGTAEFPNGTSRKGDNLYSDSTVVLDAKTGAYQWHHQTIQHDLFDRDLLHTMLTEVKGVPLVISTGKEGRVWANRRDTGETVWGPTLVGMHKNDELTELTAATQLYPGSFGGVLTPPATAEGVVYVATLNAPAMFTPNETSYFGSEIGMNKGDVVAIDAATGDILWDTLVDGDPTGGVTVVNDLVLTATFQGDVFGLDRKTGKEVWRWKAPGGINSWMTVADDTLIIPCGAASPPTVVALRLGAGAGPATPPPSTPTAGSGGSSGASTGPATFSSIYTDILMRRCAGPLCHGGAPGGSLNVMGADAKAARASLVGKAASGSGCSSSTVPIVTAGNPDQSLLYLKLTGNPPCGGKMPPTGAIPAAELERIKMWIANGAADN
jgi:outer membrane protein assembly factor BamB